LRDLVVVVMARRDVMTVMMSRLRRSLGRRAADGESGYEGRNRGVRSCLRSHLKVVCPQH